MNQGTIHQVSYVVHNYINASRQLVTNQNIHRSEAGREIVQGAAITKTCSVYLPAGYNKDDRNTNYNVLYLLHGVGGDDREWLDDNVTEGGNYNISTLLDTLIASGEIEPLIVVFPNGRSAVDYADRSFNTEGTNMLGFYYFDYELRYDLIPFIESKYHTRADIADQSAEGVEFSRKHRAIAGLSMGGMQALNLIVGGHRCDSAKLAGQESAWRNGLVATVPAPGMTDLFDYIGAFSNAPTSSEGRMLGSSIASSGRSLELLYLICGTRDEISISCYEGALAGLAEAAGGQLHQLSSMVVEGGVHDFHVWNIGAEHFLKLAFLPSRRE